MLVQRLRPAAGQTVNLAGYSDIDQARIGKGEEVIAIEGFYKYDNGFGDIVNEKVCVWYLELAGSRGTMNCVDAKTAIEKVGAK